MSAAGTLTAPDKQVLIGTCCRIDVPVNLRTLQDEVGAIDPALWDSAAGRKAVQRSAGAIFLRGYAPAEGEKPIEDRPILKDLPYCRRIIEGLLGASPLRCLLARLPPEKVIPPHKDRGDYFENSIRIHIPVFTHPAAWMMCGDLVFSMREGEVWALNNSIRHAVWNSDRTRSRTHLICDFGLTESLKSMLLGGKRSLGTTPEPDFQSGFDAAVAAHLSAQ